MTDNDYLGRCTEKCQKTEGAVTYEKNYLKEGCMSYGGSSNFQYALCRK